MLPVMQTILEGASKMELIRHYGQLTPAKIIKGDFPTLGALSRKYGIEKTEKVMAVILHDLSSSFDGDLSKTDVEEICVELTSSHLRNFAMEDVLLVCRQIKQADNYGKLNINKVLKAMNQHFEKRCDAIEEMNNNQHYSQKFTDPTRKSISDKDKEKYHAAKLKYIIEQSKMDKA